MKKQNQKKSPICFLAERDFRAGLAREVKLG